MKLPGLALSLAVAGFALIIPEAAEAARINELSDSTLMDRAARFFTFKDPSLRNALAGSMLLGVCCGLMGAFLVVRKLSLLGDALSHAVLPGVALGFLWNMSKIPSRFCRGDSGRFARSGNRPTLARDHQAQGGCRSGLCACLILRHRIAFHHDPELPEATRAGWTNSCSARRPHSEGAMSSSSAL